MKNFNKFVLVSALSLIGQSAFAVTIDDASNNATDLANSILGSGVTISGETYMGDTDQSGFFSGGLGSIGIEDGLVLTTGSVFDAEGPNASDSTSTSTSTGGLAILDALIPQSTNDAAMLAFEFTTDTGDLFFNYVFASEEYNEFVNSSFNDVFAFFVNGVNIAEAPDGNPVSINNVNCGNPLIGAGPNCEFYNNNDPSDGGPLFDVEYDGFTDVFTASITGLDTAATHTMQIAIADAGDSALDSAVFIQGSSFSSTPIDVPEAGSLGVLILAFVSLMLSRVRRKA